MWPPNLSCAQHCGRSRALYKLPAIEIIFHKFGAGVSKCNNKHYNGLTRLSTEAHHVGQRGKTIVGSPPSSCKCLDAIRCSSIFAIWRMMGDPKPSALSPMRVGVPAAVFEQLLGYIVSGEWKEGQRIFPERELCQQLGVARPSLREALKALEIIGLVDSRVGAGTFVRKRADFLSRPLLWAIAGSSSAGANELVESRLVLEGELAGFAAERATMPIWLKSARGFIRLKPSPTKCSSSTSSFIWRLRLRRITRFF